MKKNSEREGTIVSDQKHTRATNWAGPPHFACGCQLAANGSTEKIAADTCDGRSALALCARPHPLRALLSLGWPVDWLNFDFL